MCSFDSVVVITSVSHTEGREFDPRSKYFCLNIFVLVFEILVYN